MAFVCAIVVACGGEIANRYTNAQIGQPCMSVCENHTTFREFELNEVSVELPAPDADPGVLVCLMNHFRGRVTCPYGQSKDALELPAVDGASGGPFSSGVSECKTPQGVAVTGSPADPTNGALVEPQCADRRPARAVTWSCRCAAADGTTNDGATYCTCPTGTECSQVVVPIGSLNDDISGAYCIPVGSEYDPMTGCTVACDPAVTTCP